MHVLAGVEGAQADLHVRLRRRQVDDDLYRRVGQQGVDAHRAQPEFVGPGTRGGLVQVGQRVDLQDGECLGGVQVGRADVAAADDADADGRDAGLHALPTRFH
jgi:hypothetical protein